MKKTDLKQKILRQSIHRKVYFISHCNKNTGAGHIMRSLSLALAFQKNGYEISFFSKYQQGIEMIQKMKIKVIPMQCNTLCHNHSFFYGSRDELEEDIAYIAENISEIADTIVVDTYNVSKVFFSKLKELTKCLIYIDDLNAFSYPVDLLVNGTASAFDIGYEKKQSAYLLLGLKYNLLRPEFCGLDSREVKTNIKHILITTGNSDPCHMTEQLLCILLKEEYFTEFRYHVIVGNGFNKDIWLNPSIINNEKVKLYDEPEKLQEIMMRCDLAVAAGGTTLYELAACGVPAIVFAYAENQLPHIKALEKRGMIKYIGYYENVDKSKLRDYIIYFMSHLSIRRKLIAELQSLIDGNGSERVVMRAKQYVEERG